MRRGRVILAFALALLWLGIPVHCQWEAIADSPLFTCSEPGDCSDPADSSCADDFCASIESEIYRSEGSTDFNCLAPALTSWHFAPIHIALADAPMERSTSDTILWLASAWHIAHGVATPPRAPSFLS